LAKLPLPAGEGRGEGGRPTAIGVCSLLLYRWIKNRHGKNNTFLGTKFGAVDQAVF
jgi:hypothetical protein